jgi:hypothetical protein
MSAAKPRHHPHRLASHQEPELARGPGRIMPAAHHARGAAGPRASGAAGAGRAASPAAAGRAAGTAVGDREEAGAAGEATRHLQQTQGS